MNAAHGIAVKAVIENSAGEYLIVRRRSNDEHQAGTWDLPGGRIDPGENPYEALIRECKEEAGVSITIDKPIGVNYFTRDDGQMIVMIIFYCHTQEKEITLSEEHDIYKWTTRTDAQAQLVFMGHALLNI